MDSQPFECRRQSAIEGKGLNRIGIEFAFSDVVLNSGSFA